MRMRLARRLGAVARWGVVRGWWRPLSLAEKVAWVKREQAAAMARRVKRERREQARREVQAREQHEWEVAAQIAMRGMYFFPREEDSGVIGGLEAWGRSTVLDDGSRERRGSE